MADVGEPLAASLRGLGKGGLLVVTGAGVSVASGIPTFRGNDPGAIWKRDVTELGTRRYFEEDPVGSWRWYLQRFDRVADARPNAAHEAIVDLERQKLAAVLSKGFTNTLSCTEACTTPMSTWPW